MIYSWHKETWDKFVKARTHGHLPHALLLSGVGGIGKLALAKSMVKSLLCLKPENYQACDNCQGCKTYESDANPDYLQVELLEGKQQIGVDQIRQIANFLNYTRSFNAYRVILLNPAERMNKNAANSLLKSLEEPTNNTVIILLTESLGSIIPTIKSRCQLLPIATPTKKQSIDWLQAYEPVISNPESALEIANGKPLYAIDIDENIVKSREELAVDILDITLENKSISEIAKKWEKFDLTSLLNWQITWVQSYIKNTQNITSTQLKIKEKIPSSHQWELYQALLVQKGLVHTSVNTLIFVENMLISWLKASQCYATK